MTYEQITERVREWHNRPKEERKNKNIYEFIGVTKEEYNQVITARINERNKKNEGMTDEYYEGLMSKMRKDNDLKNKCPKCGLSEAYVEPVGSTGMLGNVRCSSCDTYVRGWDAY